MLQLQNIKAADIAGAEAAGDVALLASIARQLLGNVPRARATKAKPATDDSYLTLTERRALGLPIPKDGKMGADKYRWVYVEFENGFRCVTGYYPRAKKPDDITPAIISARARYLGALSGRILDARKACDVPRVTGARIITDQEAEELRRPCRRMRTALEAFLEQAREERRKRVYAYLKARRDRKTRRQFARLRFDAA